MLRGVPAVVMGELLSALRGSRAIVRRSPGTDSAAPRGFYHPRMASSKPKASAIETVEPIGDRVLVRKDEDKKVTKVGIHLPDKLEIPTITGRIVAISAQIENDEDVPLRQYDKILFHPKNAIPVDFESDNQLFVIPVEDVVAVFRRGPREDEAKGGDPDV